MDNTDSIDLPLHVVYAMYLHYCLFRVTLLFGQRPSYMYSYATCLRIDEAVEDGNEEALKRREEERRVGPHRKLDWSIKWRLHHRQDVVDAEEWQQNKSRSRSLPAVKTSSVRSNIVLYFIYSVYHSFIIYLIIAYLLYIVDKFCTKTIKYCHRPTFIDNQGRPVRALCDA